MTADSRSIGHPIGPAWISRTEAAGLCSLIVGLIFVLRWQWLGYLASDDEYFFRAAVALLQDPTSVGSNHWSLRYTIVVPLTALVKVFGAREICLGMIGVGYLLGTLLVTYLLIRRYFGWPVACAAMAILSSMPGFLAHGTYASTDIAELFFDVASLAAYLRATEGREANRWAFICGICAGLGLLTRETTAALILFFGLAFVLRPMMPRTAYLIIGLGCALVVSLQLGWHLTATGDPFYRYRLSAHHDVVDRDRMAAAAQIFDLEGNLTVGRLVDPLIVPFVRLRFGLAPWFALGLLATWSWWRRSTAAGALRVLLVLVAAGVVWFGFIAGASGILYLVPRYIVFTAWMLAVVAAIVLFQLWVARPAVGLAAAAALVGTNLLLMSLENNNPLFPERKLLEVAAEFSPPLLVDERTESRARPIFDRAGMPWTLSTATPTPGALVAYVASNIESCRTNFRCSLPMEGFAVGPGWFLVRRYDAPESWLAPVLRWLGAFDRLPVPARRKLDHLDQSLVLYRVR
jgi:4-amino-4-deoxy-L-arabinose transferase-like glycosyltransferase